MEITIEEVPGGWAVGGEIVEPIIHRSPILALQRGAFPLARNVRPDAVKVRWQTITEAGYNEVCRVTHRDHITRAEIRSGEQS